MKFGQHNNERIVCPAVWIDIPDQIAGIDKSLLPSNLENGILICGFCHFNCAALAANLKISVDTYPKVYGYLTSKNRFVDRHEGATIHRGKTAVPGILYSDDLY